MDADCHVNRYRSTILSSLLTRVDVIVGFIEVMEDVLKSYLELPTVECSCAVVQLEPRLLLPAPRNDSRIELLPGQQKILASFHGRIIGSEHVCEV